MDLNNKLEDILTIVKEIGLEDEAVGGLLMESFSIALNTIQIMAANEKHERSDIDMTDQITMVSAALNFDLEELVLYIVSQQDANSINISKDADEETLDFITANKDIDDYDQFIKDNEILETLEELKKEV